MQQQFNTVPLIEGCAALGLAPDTRQLEKLIGHIDLLAKWNRRLNLTAVKSHADMVSHHLLDSLSIVPYLRGKSLLDIGTGAGFPGLPIAILNPEQGVTLMDSRGKRIEFLRHVAASLNLENVTLEHCRVENYRPQEKFDTLVARAFTSLGELISLSAALQIKGTRLLAQKGRFPHEELEALPEELRSKASVKELKVPLLDAERHLVIMDF